MPKSERAAAIKSFESGETWILSNVSLFGEGFDVSACDGVILLRKTSSLSLFIQMCGRAMRPHESKEKAIILDHMSNVAQHGLPDDDHDWSLEGRKKGKKKTSEVVPIRQCPKCYFVFEPQRCCPQCGFDMGKTPEELEKIEGELKEVIREQEAIQQIQKKREVGQAKTLQDLEKIALERGYKKGWAHAIFTSRANKK
jgi:superfamily II DNA or RNA helicase